MADETTQTTETPEGTVPTGAVLLDGWDARRECSTPAARACPGCFERIDTVALTRLVYAFDICRCDGVEYAHLVEVAWHRACFAASERPATDAERPVGV